MILLLQETVVMMKRYGNEDIFVNDSSLRPEVKY